jgi:hypothetical protein
LAANTQKYLTYAEAWRRIRAGLEGGWHFEVVALCESVISDRLLSYVRGAKANSTADVHTAFGRLIAEWRRLAVGTLPGIGASELGGRVDRWRMARNTVIHGFAKSKPGMPTEPVGPFLSRAQAIAEEGAALAREVQKWHRQQLTAKRRGHASV